MELIAQKREELGKKSKRLKQEGLTPAVIFGKGMESVPISLNSLEFAQVFEKAGETELIDVKVDGTGDTLGYKILVREVQYNPVTDQLIHVGLYKPDLTVKTNADIPLEIIGEEENELVKSGEGLILTLLDSIEVSALPADLPHTLKLDVSRLAEIGDGITVAELEYDKEKVEIVGLEEDMMIVKVDYAEMEEEPEEEVSEEEALEGIEATEETAEDGEEGEKGTEAKPAEKVEEADEKPEK